MNTNRPSLPHKAFKTRLFRVFGFSLIEAVVTIATLGILAGTAVSVIGGANEAAHNSRLQRDVAVLNTAVASYFAAGGPNIKEFNGVDLIAKDDQRTVNDVLNSLKSRIVNQAVNPDDPAGNPLAINGYSVGAEGPFIDPQLSFESNQVQSGRLYAYWDQARSRFAVANDKENPPSDAGVGSFDPGDANPRISRFFINDNLTAVVGTEFRPMGTRTYNTEDGWVWGSQEAVRSVVASVGPISRDNGINQTPDTPNTQNVATPPTKDIDSTGINGSVPEIDPSYNSNPQKLKKPVANPPTTQFQTFASIQNVTLVNTNESGESIGKSYVAYRTASARNAQGEPLWGSWVEGPLGGNAVVEVPKGSSKVPEFLIEYYAFSRDPNWLPSDNGDDKYTIAIRPLAIPVPNVYGNTFNTFASLPKNVILDNPNEDTNNEARGASVIKYRLADTQTALSSAPWQTASSVDDFELVLSTATRYKNKFIQYYAEPKPGETEYWSKSPEAAQTYTMARRPLVSPEPSVPPQLWLDFNDVPLSVQLLTPSINPEAVLGTDYIVRYRTSESNSNFNDVNWTNGSEFTIPRKKADFYAQYETKSLDDDYWISSPAAGGNYETIYFAGTPATSFSNSVGDRGLQETYSNNNQSYAWGTPAIESPYDGRRHRNTINVVNGSSFEASINQEFKIADISYFNSTTYSNTNATGIRLNIVLQGLIGSNGQPLSCYVPITLYSSPNAPGEPNTWTLDQQRSSADSLQFGQAVFGGSTTVVFKGRSFKLDVVVRAQTAYGFNFNNDPNDFRVFEFRGATGGIFGKFVLQ